MAIDKNGLIYVADAANHRIRVVTPQGEVSTLAGSFKGYRDSVGGSAQFNSPYGLAVDSDLNVFVADTYNHRIRKIAPNGEVSTIAGSGVAGFKDASGFQAQFNLPFSLDVDALGNLYVADAGNHRIRKISPLGVVSTLAGTGSSGRVDGSALGARFAIPNDVAVDSDKNIFVADFGNHCVRKISFGGLVTTIAGNGVSGYANGIGSDAQFNSPTGVSLGNDGSVLIVDNSNNRIRKVSSDGQVSDLAGNGIAGLLNGFPHLSQFNGPTDVVISSDGAIYISDTGNNVVRIIK